LELKLVFLLNGLNTFFVFIFVVFVAHFDIMFKMVIIFTIRILFGHLL